MTRDQINALKRIKARWEEYGPTNTSVGRMCDAEGNRCAIGDIAHIEGGIPDASLRTLSGTMGAYYVVERVLGLTPDEVAEIFTRNDGDGRRPVEYLQEIIDREEAKLAEAEPVREMVTA